MKQILEILCKSKDTKLKTNCFEKLGPYQIQNFANREICDIKWGLDG